jgi:hypothetical protein
MSAYIMDDEEIAFIVREGMRAPVWDNPGLLYCYWGGKSHQLDAQQVFDALRAENYRSVNYRYQEQTPCPPANYRYQKLPPERGYHEMTSITAALRAIESLDYQSCECPDWHETAAYDILQRLTWRIIHRLPGYDEQQTVKAQAQAMYANYD